MSTSAEQQVSPTVTDRYQQSPIWVWPTTTSRSSCPSSSYAGCSFPAWLECCTASPLGSGRDTVLGVPIVPIMRSPMRFPDSGVCRGSVGLGGQAIHIPSRALDVASPSVPLSVWQPALTASMCPSRLVLLYLCQPHLALT